LKQLLIILGDPGRPRKLKAFLSHFIVRLEIKLRAAKNIMFKDTFTNFSKERKQFVLIV